MEAVVIPYRWSYQTGYERKTLLAIYGSGFGDGHSTRGEVVLNFILARLTVVASIF